MRTRVASLLIIIAGLAAIAAPPAALADRGRGSDDRQTDDRRGRGSDDAKADDRSGRGGGEQQARQDNRVRELRFIARMREADGTVARARYQERARNGRALRQRFDVEIKFAQPGEQFAVSVNGRFVGTVTIGSLGTGKLELRPTPDDPGELPTPADFPRLRAGAVVTVGPMQGTLSRQ